MEAASTDTSRSQEQSPPPPPQPKAMSIAKTEFQDSLALGNYVQALEEPLPTTSSSESLKERHTLELSRLPFLLRLLSTLQPIADLSRCVALNETSSLDEKDALLALESSEAEQRQTEINHLVSLLEMVVVRHASAESIEVLTSHLAPKLAKEWNLAKPLTTPPLARISPQVRLVPVAVQVPAAGGTSVKHPVGSASSTGGGGNPKSDNKATKVESTIQLEYQTRYIPNGSSTLSTPDCIVVPGWNTTAFPSMGAGSRDNVKSHDENNGSSMEIDSPSPNRKLLQVDSSSSFAMDIDEEDEDEDEEPAVSSTPQKAQDDRTDPSPSPWNQRNEDTDLDDADTQEATTAKILSELIDLVTQSLQPLTLLPGRGEDGRLATLHSSPNRTATSHPGSLALSIKPDSLLSEEPPSHPTNHPKMEESQIQQPDLPSTIASLLPHIPSLKYKHVSNALCRAALPPAPFIIASMVCNAPNLYLVCVRGCLDAYLAAQYQQQEAQQQQEEKHQQQQQQQGSSSLPFSQIIVQEKDIMDTSKKALMEIARISLRGKSHIRSELIQSKVLPDLVLEWGMELDPISTCAALVNTFQSTERRNPYPSSSVLKGNPISNRTRKRTRRHILHKCQLSRIYSRERGWMDMELQSNEGLASSMRASLLSQMSKVVKSMTYDTDSNTRIGEASFESVGGSIVLLRAYMALIDHVGIGAGSTTGSGSTFVERATKIIMNFCTHILDSRRACEQCTNADLPESSPCDEVLKFSICACLITCSKFPPIIYAKGYILKTPSIVACSVSMNSLLTLRVSKKSNVFIQRVVQFLRTEDHNELHSLVASSSRGNSFVNVCRWAKMYFLSKLTTSDVLSKKSPYNIPLLIDAGRRCQIEDCKFDRYVSLILDDSELCAILDGGTDATTLMIVAIEALVKRSPPILPLVMPLSLEVLSKKFVKSRTDISQCKGINSQFLMQLLYALLFFDRLPSSPFVIDPRTFPLREVIQYGRKIGSSFVSKIEDLVQAHCPEVLVLQGSYILPFESEGFSPKDIGPAILQCTCPKKNEWDNVEAERIFFLARASQPSSDVYKEAAFALLQSAKGNSPYLSYQDLCRDPLVLLKCSLNTWRQSSLRRILLTILEHLMLVNELMVRKFSLTSEVAEEYLASRNVLVVRCFLIMMSGSLLTKTKERIREVVVMFCPMMILVVRKMVTKCPGLIATIVKQGASDSVMDWIIDFIPESLSNARLLAQFLESRSLNAVERLKVADFSLRIAITHGSRNETDAQPLVYAALSVLVSSFYLVVGPVGVPVNVVCNDEGQDMTLLCRVPMFRMITVLQTIGSKRTQIKNEAVMALQKLMSFCKSDVSGLVGAAAAKRKVLLKEIYDVSMKSITCLGGTI